MTDKLNLTEPSHDCPLCPRLAEFRALNRQSHPKGFNGPVPGWGDPDARLLIVGFAPAQHGANLIGRPFTNEYAGDVLFGALATLGLAEGEYRKRADDELVLKDVFVSYAVRCAAPENKPLPAEAHTCRPFLERQMKQLPNLKAVLALGQAAHQSVIKAAGGKLPKCRFEHGAVHRLPSGLMVIDSLHISYPHATSGKLTPEMVEAVLKTAVEALDQAR